MDNVSARWSTPHTALRDFLDVTFRSVIGRDGPTPGLRALLITLLIFFLWAYSYLGLIFLQGQSILPHCDVEERGWDTSCCVYCNRRLVKEQFGGTGYRLDILRATKGHSLNLTDKMVL
ncbi:hypothetical protein AVEN_133636-1 [Araneus ventricosus]|uniref:Uncharacterized protein n=1 Tax=Araneus ventricosus TaxID=182803 RepID=A0A4Y2MUF9_ARAVE|nr:hypothetical protein AVEN_133636-1 [Araneus ventricosus]